MGEKNPQTADPLTRREYADEREHRDHEGQRRLLDQLDDDVIREYADTIATTERS